MNFREMTKEQLQEESLINLAFTLLTDRREALELQDLFKAIQDVSGYTDAEMEEKKLQFNVRPTYTKYLNSGFFTKTTRKRADRNQPSSHKALTSKRKEKIS